MADGGRVYLFLQGPISPFFQRLADRLEALDPGARTLRINLCFGDRLFWRRKGGVDYRGRLSDWPAFIDAFIRDEGVTDVILLGEQRDYHQAAAAAAKRHGVAVVATDFGYLRPDWIAFELDGLTGASRFPRDPASVRALAAASSPPDLAVRFRDPFWRMAAFDIVYHLATSFLWFLYPRYRSHLTEHPIATYFGTGWRLLNQKRRGRVAAREIEAAERRSGPTFVFPLQMARDFSMRVYSRFSSLEAAIDEIVASFAAHAPADAHLVLKVHPLDSGLTDWARAAHEAAAAEGVADRMSYIDGGDLARLIEASAGVVVVNSTVGLLSLQLATPTIALGQALYDLPGLTARTGLDAFWRAPPPPDSDMVDAFVRAVAGAIMIRGTFYSDPGLAAAVEAAARRLDAHALNQPLAAAE